MSPRINFILVVLIEHFYMFSYEVAWLQALSFSKGE